MTAITFPNNPNTDPGVGGQYEAENGLIYVWDGEKWESLGTNNANPNNFVAVSGDNMTGDLTLGPDDNSKITLNATDGRANFADRKILFEKDGFVEFDRRDSGNPYGLVRFNVSNAACNILDNANALKTVLSYDGSASFASGVAIRGYKESDNNYGINLNKSLTIKRPPSELLNSQFFIRAGGGNMADTDNHKFSVRGDGSAEFAGDIDIAGAVTNGTGIAIRSAGFISIRRDTLNDVFTIFKGGNENENRTIQFRADGAGYFMGDIFCGLKYNLPNPSRVGVAIRKEGMLQLTGMDGNILFRGYKEGVTDPTIDIGVDGTATFAGGNFEIKSSGEIRISSKCNISVDTSSNVVNYGSATSGATVRLCTGSGSGNVVGVRVQGGSGFTTFPNGASTSRFLIELEPDNDANYTVTSDVDEEGNTFETRVYTGPNLDVKAVIQELQQRVADRDAVIADFTARLAALEADHAVLMGNNNGGY